MTVAEELEYIRSQNDGVLLAEHVVEYAKDPETALHSRFTWDDTKAASEYRLWQAREVIRVMVTILPHSNTPIQAYVSLKDDRKEPGGGYRQICDVMSDADLREKLISEALGEFERIAAKYKQLQELKPVFEVIAKTKKRSRRKVAS